MNWLTQLVQRVVGSRNRGVTPDNPDTELIKTRNRIAAVEHRLTSLEALDLQIDVTWRPRNTGQLSRREVA